MQVFAENMKHQITLRKTYLKIINKHWGYHGLEKIKPAGQAHILFLGKIQSLCYYGNHLLANYFWI